MELNKAEKGSDYYDYKNDKYKLHYRKLKCYTMFERALSVIDGSVFEIGCGAGQFANMVCDKGLKYFGFDFSVNGIAIARLLDIDAEFVVGDARNSSIYLSNFDYYVSFEVLEHISADKKVLANIPYGKNFIFSLPYANDPAHVRIFKTKDDIMKRYTEIDIESIERFYNWWLCFGVKI